jgi:hypothetical protein
MFIIIIGFTFFMCTKRNELAFTQIFVLFVCSEFIDDEAHDDNDDDDEAPRGKSKKTLEFVFVFVYLKTIVS